MASPYSQLGVAEFTFIHHNDTSADGLHQFTVATSLAIPPLLGASFSRLITRRFKYCATTFWPNLLGAYAGAGLSMGSVAILHRASVPDAAIEDDSQHFNENTAQVRVQALRALFQILLPVVLPGLGAAAGYALDKAPRPTDTHVSFLSPTIFHSPSYSPSGALKKKYILGVQLISARF